MESTGTIVSETMMHAIQHGYRPVRRAFPRIRVASMVSMHDLMNAPNSPAHAG